MKRKRPEEPLPPPPHRKSPGEGGTKTDFSSQGGERGIRVRNRRHDPGSRRSVSPADRDRPRHPFTEGKSLIFDPIPPAPPLSRQQSESPPTLPSLQGRRTTERIKPLLHPHTRGDKRVSEKPLLPRDSDTHHTSAQRPLLFRNSDLTDRVGGSKD